VSRGYGGSMRETKERPPSPYADFSDIWDWFYEDARQAGLDVDEAEGVADEMAASYSR
jgi:hypothetical protein